MQVQMHMGVQVFSCRSSEATYIAFRDRVSHWPQTCQADQAGYLASPGHLWIVTLCCCDSRLMPPSHYCGLLGIKQFFMLVQQAFTG